jgi:hypothetical protein
MEEGRDATSLNARSRVHKSTDTVVTVAQIFGNGVGASNAGIYGIINTVDLVLIAEWVNCKLIKRVEHGAHMRLLLCTCDCCMGLSSRLQGLLQLSRQ